MRCSLIIASVALAGLAFAAQSAEAIFRSAATALASQDYKAAEQGFLAVLKLEPRNIGAIGNLGVILFS